MIGTSHAPSLINLLRVAAGDCLTFKLQNLPASPLWEQARSCKGRARQEQIGKEE
ncbi:hypothetical protein OKW11_005077 [Pseudomonas baetica]|nr:hypothetical protein [Pseudomonas baetica]